METAIECLELSDEQSIIWMAISMKHAENPHMTFEEVCASFEVEAIIPE